MINDWISIIVTSYNMVIHWFYYIWKHWALITASFSTVFHLPMISQAIHVAGHRQEYCRNRPEDMRGPYELQPKLRLMESSTLFKK
jgi:hypothetical protein